MNALPMTPLISEIEARYCTDPAKPFPGEEIPLARRMEASPWYVIRVTPRQEGYVREVLEDKGIDCYFPWHKTFPLKAKRKATRERPLIAGFVFACVTEERAIDIIRSVRGYREIWCGADGEPRRVPPLHLGAMILAEAFHEYDETWVPPKPKGKRYHHRWQKDEVVHIEDGGPFHGFNGRVVRTNRKDRITLEVRLFGRPSEVEVKTKHLRALK